MRFSPFSSTITSLPSPDYFQTIRTRTTSTCFYISSQNRMQLQDRAFRSEGHPGCITSALVLGWKNRRMYSTDIKGNKDKNYYKILGVTPNCSKSRIKVAYYKLSKKYHPDVNKTDEAKQTFQDISEAYDVLSNALTRQQYDNTRASSSPHFRGNATHGQEKYKSKNIYPMGRSSTYNFDKWHDRHYKSSLGEALRQKRVRERREASVNTERVNQGMSKSVQEPSLMPFVLLATVITMFGLGYMFMQKKIESLQHNVRKKS